MEPQAHKRRGGLEATHRVAREARKEASMRSVPGAGWRAFALCLLSHSAALGQQATTTLALPPAGQALAVEGRRNRVGGGMG